MNQILVTEKLYVTPDMKKKKNLFKIEFVVSVFLMCILSSYAIYADYDRNKSEQVSQQILSNMNLTETNTTEIVKKKIIVVTIDKDKKQASNAEKIIQQPAQAPQEQNTTINGVVYSTIGQIDIPSINVSYPILANWSDALLKVSPCKFYGPNPNEAGNLCIIGHNYLNSKFFSKVPTLQSGDQILITDLSGKTVTYQVFNKFTVEPTDTSCTDQNTNGKKEITVITCSENMKERVIVQAMAVE